MKIIRSKKPLTIGDRTKREAVVAISLSLEWQEDLYRFVATVKDYEVQETENPDGGKSYQNYIPLGEKKVTRTPEQVNGLFNFIALDIVQGDDFTEAFRNLQVKALLLDTQQNPIYNSVAEDWEIFDTVTEIAP